METREVFEKLLEEVKKNAADSLRNHYHYLRDDALQFVGKFDTDWEKYTNEKYKYRGYSGHKFSSPAYQFQSRYILTTYKPKAEQRYPGDSETVWIDGHRFERLFAREDIEENIEKLVAEGVKNMVEGFIQKQTKKTDDIIKGRTAEVTGRITSRLECYFTFKLADGASFDMKTQIVWKVSCTGKDFWAFPTTFHNAVKANGEKIGTPSEPKLKKEL